MKKLSAILLSLTALVIMFFSFGCKPTATPPTPPADTQAPTVPGNLTGTSTSSSVSLTWNASTDNVAVTGYRIYRAGTQIGTSITASYSDNTVAGNTPYSYTVAAYDAAGNVSGQSVAFVITTQVAYTAVFTSVDASSTATLKSLPGNSVAKALVLNVTTPGFVKLETIGSLTNGNPAIGYWWITSKDSSEVFQSASTLNPLFVKIVAATSQNINLSAGVNVICFKTAPFTGAVTNGSSIGLKVTGANNNVVSTSAYTADATSTNVANVVKIFMKQVGGVSASANLQTTGFPPGNVQVIPYSDEAGTIYDGNLYPSINFLSFDTKDTRWIGSTTGYAGLDFTNALGSAGRNLQISQIDGTVTPAVQRNVFTNSQATLSSGVVTFSSTTSVQMVKSNLGNYAYASTYANVYNPTSTQFGPTTFCWYLKSIRFAGNPELWIYDPSGVRIW